MVIKNIVLINGIVREKEGTPRDWAEAPEIKAEMGIIQYMSSSTTLL